MEGLLISVESLTYADLADRLGTTQEAARSLVRRLRLPRQTGNDGKVRINIDLAEIQYKPQPARSPSGHQPDIETLKEQIAGLQDELKNLEAENSMIRSSAAGHRADFERERERCERLMVEVLKATAELMAAREATARIAGELAAYQARPWWRRWPAERWLPDGPRPPPGLLPIRGLLDSGGTAPSDARQPRPDRRLAGRAAP